MWQKYFLIILLFYFFAILQNSFFTHFSLFGAVPDIVFILFFALVFFANKNNFYQFIFYSVTAGFFLDIFSAGYFGQNIIIILIIGFLLKKIQGTIRGESQEFSIVYFLPIFFVFLAFYYLLIFLASQFLGLEQTIILGFNLFYVAVYNLFFAGIIFWVYKKFSDRAIDNRQLKLFK